MKDARRIYVYLAAAVALEVVAWAAISLLRQLLAGSSSPDAVAFQTAAILVGLPVFLLHWRWANSALRSDATERMSVWRRLYLYGLRAAFAIPILSNAAGLLDGLLRTALASPGGAAYAPVEGSLGQLAARNLAALAVLGALWLWLWLLARAEERAEPPTGDAATVRRLHHLGFSALGGVLLGIGLTRTLRWVLLMLDTGPWIARPAAESLASALTLLLVGLPLWALAWRAAESLLAGPAGDEERRSALRLAYIYLGVAGAALVGVAHAAMLLYGGLRRLLDLPAQGSWQGPVPTMLVCVLILLYHGRVLRGETAAAHTPRGASVRRVYVYLVAAAGLAALLVGLSAEIAVLVRALAEGFGAAEREQVAWATAVLLAGLPMWALAWGRAQRVVRAGTSAGVEENATSRKVYLYFFLLVAALMVLSGAVYLVYRLLANVLGAAPPPDLAARLGWALSAALVGASLWLYHLRELKLDDRQVRRGRAERLAALGVVLLEPGDGRFARAVLDGLAKELPDLAVDVLPLTAEAATALDAPAAQGDAGDRIRRAGLTVTPWPLAAAAGEWAAVLAASPARKLLVPLATPDVAWAGVGELTPEEAARRTVAAVIRLADGEDVAAGGLGGAAAAVVALVAVVAAVFGVLMVIGVVFGN